jgi:hypothetical protein
MTPTPTQVRKALTVFDNPDDSETWEADRNMGQALGVLAAATRAWLDLFTECELCEDGWVRDDPADDDPDASMSGCPQCHVPGETGGRGYTLNEERVEAAAQAMYDDEWRHAESMPFVDDVNPDYWRHQARAAILAYLGEPR